MEKATQVSALGGLMLIAALACGPVSAQTPNAFGATIRNPGSIVPEWWNETRYIPERVGDSLHLRQGSAGNFNGMPNVGRANCDLAMLFATVAGAALTPAELEKCALLEYDIYRGVSGDQRNLNDVFVRRDTVAQFSEKVKERMALFRQTKSFYLRASAMDIEPFQVGKGLRIRANWTGGYLTPDGSPPIYYYFEEDGGFLRSNPNWWGTVLNGFNDAQAREIESARSSGKFVTALNFFRFEPVSAREVRNGSSVERYLRVKVTEFSVPYVTANGGSTLLGFKK
jgi:hypothetical protein